MSSRERLPHVTPVILVVIVALLITGLQLHAQTVRGVVSDSLSRPISNVLVALVDSADGVIAHSLSGINGEFVLRSPLPGNFRVRALRIGFRPAVSPLRAISLGQTVVQLVVLDQTRVRLQALRTFARSNCGRRGERDADDVNAIRVAWEQAAGSMATALTMSTSRSYTATMLSVNRMLDARGQRIKTQESRVETARVSQPWRSQSMTALHRDGYIVTYGDSAIYYPPGLDAVISAQFLRDHCLTLITSPDSSEFGVRFEPAPTRSSIPEVRGTVWMTKDAEILRLEFTFTGVPRSLGGAAASRAAGGTISFVELPGGGVLIKEWELRIPELITRSPASLPTVKQVVMTGGLLVVLRQGSDTLFRMTYGRIRGELRDSVSNGAILDGVISLVGTNIHAKSGKDGEFSLDGVLPGEYTMQVRTPALDSIGTAIHRAVLIDRADVTLITKVPSNWTFANAICDSVLTSAPSRSSPDDTLRGIILGRLRVNMNGLPIRSPTLITASWTTHTAPSLAQGVVQVVQHERESLTNDGGNFSLCRLPVDRAISVQSHPMRGRSAPIVVRLTMPQPFLKLSLAIDTSAATTATFTGTVQSSQLLPLSGVEIAIPALSLASRTDTLGRYALGSIAPGTYEITARRVGYGPLSATVTFAESQAIERALILSAVTTLQTVDVNATLVDARLADFETRRKIGIGRFYSPDSLKRLGGKTLSSILTVASGVRIYSGGGSDAWIASSRASASKRELSAYDQKLGAPRVCYATVFVDGVAVYRGLDGEPLFNANSLRAEDIEAIEYYAGPAETPARYSQANSNCGALVIWRKL